MRVAAFETNGDESFIHGRVEGEEWVLRCRDMRPVAAGASLSLSAAESDVRHF